MSLAAQFQWQGCGFAPKQTGPMCFGILRSRCWQKDLVLRRAGLLRTWDDCASAIRLHRRRHRSATPTRDAIAVWRSKRSVRIGAPDVGLTVRDVAWEGSRDFRVTGRAFEDPAQSQCSFTLVPVDGAPLPPFKPGQFLTFSLPVAGADAPGRVIRCYSISDTPDPGHIVSPSSGPSRRPASLRLGQDFLGLVA